MGNRLGVCLAAVVAVLCLLVTPSGGAQADEPDDLLPECVISLTNGTRYSGLLLERGEEELVLRIGGVETRFAVNQVSDIEILAPVEVRYQAMRETVRDDDLPRLIMLADWLRSRERFDLALAELEQVLNIDPRHPKARELRTLVLAQLALKEADEPKPGTRDDPARRRFPVLSADQINLIKVFEIDLADPPRMLIKRETIERLLDEHKDSDLLPQTNEGREAFLRLPPERILEYMFRLRARTYYSEVRVLEQPKAMKRFRENVHSTWLVNGCASSGCHGGEQAGRLWLNNRQRNADPTVYTNFLILERFRMKDGTALINYDQPALSPLLHLGLPREKSAFPHPEVVVPGRARPWRPVFRSTDDRGFVEGVEWIKSMYSPRPDYPVTYEPPSPAGLIESLDEPEEPVDR